MAKAGAPVYLYHFDHTLSFPAAWGPNYTFCDYNVTCHGSELPFVFHQHMQYSWTDQEAALSAQMANYWLNFAVNGADGLPV